LNVYLCLDDKGEERLIKINSSEIKQRQLFTFGHELYHVIKLHIYEVK